MPAVLITVEGVEGSGKSTQCARLEQHLVERGLLVVRTSEPDGTPLGLRVRGLFEAEGPTPTPLTQTFLFMAARQEHVTRVIAPALAMKVDAFLTNLRGDKDFWAIWRIKTKEVAVAVVRAPLYELDGVFVLARIAVSLKHQRVVLGAKKRIQIGRNPVT